MEELKQVYKEFFNDSIDYIENNYLVVLPEFNKLHDKNIWGEAYRLDQIYYENVSDIKSKIYGVKNHVLALLEEGVKTIDGRFAKATAEKFLDIVNNDLKMFEEILYKAKQRLKFYETITYVIGNVTYGSF